MSSLGEASSLPFDAKVQGQAQFATTIEPGGTYLGVQSKDNSESSVPGKVYHVPASFSGSGYVSSPFPAWAGNDAGSPSSNQPDIGGGKNDDRKKRRAQQSRDASREYRKRKKSHIEELEGKCGQLMAENDALRKKLAETEKLQMLMVENGGGVKKEAAPAFLQEEWKKDLATLEELVVKKEDERLVAAILDELQLKGKQLLASYKANHIGSMDWAVFAHSALFGVDSLSRGVKSAQMVLAQSSDTDPKSGIHHWLELTKDLDINDAQRKLIEEQLFTLRQHFLALRAEQESLSEDLLDMVRQGLKINSESPVDLQHILAVTTKLGELHKNYETHWALWERTMEAIMQTLTPLQKARILLRKKAYLDNVNILNSIWLTINGRSPAPAQAIGNWHPSLYPPVPLPSHLNHFL